MNKALEQLKAISEEDYTKDGYNYFGRHPEKIIAFFDKHMN